MKKTIILGTLLLLSTFVFSQTINDVKGDVTIFCKISYDLFKPIEWSNYELVYKKLPIYCDCDEVDTSLYNNIDKFFKGDTTKANFNRINGFDYGFNYIYTINNNDTINKSSVTIGRTTLNKKRYNYITDYYDDTLYFNYRDKRIITNTNDTIKILNREIPYERLPKKVDYYVNSYRIRLVYHALSKGGEVRIYSNNFIVNYHLNGTFSSIYEESK